MAVAQDHGTIGQAIVYESVAVGIPEVGTIGPGGVKGEGGDGPHRAGDAAGHQPLGPVKELLRRVEMHESILPGRMIIKLASRMEVFVGYDYYFEKVYISSKLILSILVL
jgi:hypothetical protein